jgi:cytochrome c
MRALLVGSSLALAASAAAYAQDDEAYVRYLAGECLGCHVVGAEPQGIPVIDGLPAEVFVDLFNAYRTREREHVLMNTIADRYDDGEVEALAAYFERLGQD